MKTRCHIDPGLQQKLIDALRLRADPQWFEDLSRCVPMVIDLVGQSPDHSIDARTAAIRAIVSDNCLIGAGGASRFADEAAIDRHVDLLIRELKRLRHAQLHRGEWSDAPVPPQMFG